MPSESVYRQDLTDHTTPNSHEAKASIRVRLLRAEDLLNVEVLGFGLSLNTDGGEPVLGPGETAGRLEYRFVYQHVGEQGFLADDPVAPPVHALAARPSRLVFKVPVGHRIEFSTEGLLKAMRELPLIVVPAATSRPQIPDLYSPVRTLPGGAQLFRVDGDLVISGKYKAPTGSVLSRATAVRLTRQALTAEAVQPAKTAPKGLIDLLLIPGTKNFTSKQPPRAPRPDETSIEAPFRMVISPSALEGFTHPLTPTEHPNDPRQVELWHTRLGVRGANGSIDDRPSRQKIVRAVWTRDEDMPAVNPDPFPMPLTAEQRISIVHESSDPTLVKQGKALVPQPVTARKLYLSALGAWLDLNGKWNAEDYLNLVPQPVEAWENRAAMGRDNYVKVVTAGYLYPLGHKALRVTITERKFVAGPGAAPQAVLIQREFIVVREPIRSYADSGPGKRFPFANVRLTPLVTPDLTIGMGPSFPKIGTADFEFTLHATDRAGSEITLSAPLLFVPIGSPAASVTAAYGAPSTPARSQNIAYVTPDVAGDTGVETAALVFTGTPGALTSEPFLDEASVVVPAMRMIAPQASVVRMRYASAWLNHDFGPGNAGAVFAEFIDTTANVTFGSTAESGGFVRPDLPGRGLSRSKGLIGDVDSVASGTFNPAKLLEGIDAKLFGLFKLADVLEAMGGLDKVPEFISDALGPVGQALADLARLVPAVQDAVSRMHTSGLPEPLQSQADATANALNALLPALTSAAHDVTDAIEDLLTINTTSQSELMTALTTPATALNAALANLAQFVNTASLPTAIRASLQPPLDSATALFARVNAGAADAIDGLLAFVNGLENITTPRAAHYTWQPTMRNFNLGGSPVFTVPPDGFTLDVSVRAGDANAPAGADVLAELRDFSLILPPGQTMIRMDFARLAFRGGTGRKADVDVVFKEQAFLGVLGFIDTLRKVIPSDGFSDPPFLDISPAGVRAGFDLALPNLSVGVFSLENMSLGADCHVPFLGEAVSVGFHFCTREKPFRLTVMMIGGGGFVGIRLTPKGLALLEMSLEAGASLALDFGVASGSVSAMVGIYMRLEDEKGSLTGYFRIRGEVDVLGLISASITLELSLTYEFDTGKMIGRASIEVVVEVLFFSASVSISCERRFAGSKGDPSLGQMLGIGPGQTDNDYWSQYCAAFAGV